MRKGEILNLKWEDVDFRQKYKIVFLFTFSNIDAIDLSQCVK